MEERSTHYFENVAYSIPKKNEPIYTCVKAPKCCSFPKEANVIQGKNSFQDKWNLFGEKQIM